MHNFASLMGIQLTINLSSLALVPHFSRNFGSEIWGLYVLSQSFTTFSTLIIDFGLDYTATRATSQNRFDKTYLSELTGAVLIIKLSLAALVFFIAIVISLNYELLQNNLEYLFLGVSIGAITALSPWWYFQGMEKMTFPSIVSITLYILYAIVAFLIVDGPEDGWKVLVGYLVLALCVDTMTYVRMFRNIKLLIPPFIFIRNLFRESFVLFLAKLSEVMDNSLNTIILGTYVTSSQLSFYGNSQKILKIPKITINNLIRAVYPKLSTTSVQDISKAKAIKVKITLSSFVVSLIGAIVIFFLSEKIILLIFGKDYLEGVRILEVIILSLPLFTFNKMMSVLGLAAFNKDRLFLGINILSILLNLMFLLVFLEFYGLIGIAYSLIVSELIKSLILIYYLKK